MQKQKAREPSVERQQSADRDSHGSHINTIMLVFHLQATVPSKLLRNSTGVWMSALLVQL